MNPRTKNLVLAAGAVVAVGLVGVNTLMAPPPPTVAPEAPVSEAPAHAAPSPALAASPGGAATPGDVTAAASPEPPADTDRRSYAVGLQDLAGFPADAAPGARLELWVTWEPPLTREPRLQKLIGDVLLERTIPGAVPEAPVSILLSVPADRVGDLIYADGFGKLNVVLPG